MMFFPRETWLQNLDVGTNIEILTDCWSYFGRFMGIEDGFLILFGFQNIFTVPANATASTFKIKLSFIRSVNPI